MRRNFLNLSEIEIDKPIYRIIKINRLYQMYNSQKNVLLRTRKWQDPFENYIMNSTGELPSGEIFSFGFREHFYGQCWTQKIESDALWRIYSTDNKFQGVRIRTTPRILFESLYNNSNKYRDFTCHIGKVKYFSTPGLEKLLKNDAQEWILDRSGAGQARSLLFKRNAFSYEEEVRLIYNSQGNEISDLFRYSCNPNDLIEDIVFDPRIEYKLFLKHKSLLKNMGFKKRIVKSNLYKVPELKIRFR